MIASGIQIEAGRSRDESQHAVVSGELVAENARSFQPIEDQRVAQTDRDDLVEVRHRSLDLAHQATWNVQIVHQSSRRERAAQEPRPGH